MKSPLLVSIIGGSGSGKSTIIEELKGAFDTFSPSVVSMDNYYLPHDFQRKDDNGIMNFDLPTAYNLDRFYADILSLMEGKGIQTEEYIFEDFGREAKTIKIASSPLIIVEGIFVLVDKRIRNLTDFQIFIDAHENTRLERRLLRDKKSRGLTPEIIRYQWNNHVLPAHGKYVEVNKNTADFVIDNSNDYSIDLKKCISFLKNRLESISQT